jgi:hypothetical protein
MRRAGAPPLGEQGAFRFTAKSASSVFADAL